MRSILSTHKDDGGIDVEQLTTITIIEVIDDH